MVKFNHYIDCNRQLRYWFPVMEQIFSNGKTKSEVFFDSYNQLLFYAFVSMIFFKQPYVPVTS